MSDGPEVLFVCVHNAGRSQMAARRRSTTTGGGACVFARPAAHPVMRSTPP